ncbi:putative membrane protein [Curtobacterium sp. SORGH_AS776]|nr:putative membrane protein [Curtobacterium sp. SORGH_AS_0776]
MTTWRGGAGSWDRHRASRPTVQGMPEIRAFRRLTDAVEHASVLDKAVDIDRSVVNALAKPKALRQLLHGVPFGHPLHPLMVQVPLGAWISAAVLDLIGGKGNARAAKTLVGVGLVSSGSASVAGYVDWSELDRAQLRTGWVHQAVNWVGISLYGLSWMQRKSGNHGAGKLLGFAGLAVVGVGGYLGGHLAYRQRAGVSQHGEVPFDA